MVIKKASPVKIAKSSGGKKAAKKVIKKTIPKSAVKVPAKPSRSSGGKVATKPARPSGGKKTIQKAIQKVVSKPARPSARKGIVVKKTVAVKKITTKKDANQLLVDAAVEGIQEVKGKDINILDLRGIHNRVCDYYIICQADSSTQVNAIAGSVEAMVKKRIGERPYHTEGFQNSEWILVDYVTVVVHVFQSEVREFYNLESLWADAEVTSIPD